MHVGKPFVGSDKGALVTKVKREGQQKYKAAAQPPERRNINSYSLASEVARNGDLLPPLE
jgi:hypothetical protein